MIKDEVCKVCGRPAPKGSDAYNFMVKKLEEYVEHIRQQQIIKTEKENQDEEPPLFSKSYIEELNNRKIRYCDSEAESWIAKLTPDIYETIQFVNTQKERLEQVKKV